MLNHRRLSMFFILALLFSLIVPSIASAAAKLKPVSIKFTSTTQIIKVGDTFNVNSIAKPTPKVKLSYSSSNPKIVSIDSKGIVKGIAAGKVMITAFVAQKGFSGKATLALQVVQPIANEPSTYKDLTLLDKDVRTSLQLLYKKDDTHLTAAEKAARSKLLNIDRKQLLDALITIHASAQPAWSKSWVEDFAAKNLEDSSIAAITDLFSKTSEKDKKRSAIAILKVFKSPKAIEMLSKLLTSSNDSDLKYSLSYLLSNFKSSEVAFHALTSILVTETNSMVIDNAIPSLLLVADTNTDQIKQLIITYSKLQPETKKRFTLSLYAYSSDQQYVRLYSAWKPLIQASQQSANADEKASADEIWSLVKAYSPYKD